MDFTQKYIFPCQRACCISSISRIFPLTICRSPGPRSPFSFSVQELGSCFRCQKCVASEWSSDSGSHSRKLYLGNLTESGK